MMALAVRQTKPATTAPPARSGVLQRRCACGGTPGPTGECAECHRNKRLGVGRSPLQPKLRIGRADDPLEREADRVAEQVMRMPEPKRYQQPDKEKEERLQITHLVQRRVTSSETGLEEAPPIVHDVLRSPGRQLEPPTRQFMESRFGYDFSRVRIHADEKAAAAAQAVNARAFTMGRHVVFGPNEYAPGSQEGQRLLAHELAHSIQQSLILDVHTAPASDTANGLHWGRAEHAAVQANQERRFQLQSPAQGSQPTGLSEETPTAVRFSVSEDQVQCNRGEREEALSSCPSKEELDDIEQRYRAMVEKAREDGYDVAANNLEHFLAGSGTKRTLSVDWLRGFSSLLEAERTNQERFEDQLEDTAEAMNHGDRRSLSDYWDRKFTASRFEELYYASGTSTIRSTGNFTLERIENVVNLHGTVNHHWFDIYDWHAGLSAYVPGFGSISDQDALILQQCRGAKSFDMEADWRQRLSGTIEVGWLYNDTSFTWTGT